MMRALTTAKPVIPKATSGFWPWLTANVVTAPAPNEAVSAALIQSFLEF